MKDVTRGLRTFPYISYVNKGYDCHFLAYLNVVVTYAKQVEDDPVFEKISLTLTSKFSS